MPFRVEVFGTVASPNLPARKGILALRHAHPATLIGGSRLSDKDAHDIYRLLVATETSELAETIRQLLAEDLSQRATTRALEFVQQLFAAGPDALGSTMAGRAEEGVGQPDTVSASVSFLAQDLLSALV